MTQQITTNEPGSKTLRDFWIFTIGQGFSLLGTSVVQLVLIWWLTIVASQTPEYSARVGLVLGVAAFLGFAPMVLTSLFAGVLVDRWSRKWVIFISDTIAALMAGLLMILFFLNTATIPIVLVVMTVRAVANGFQNPAAQAIIPLMVPREKLTQVNSLSNLLNNFVFLVGPSLGGVLIAIFGLDKIELIQLIDLVTYVIALFPLVLIKIPDITHKVKKEERSFKKEFREGVGFIRDTKGLLTLLTSFTVLNIFVAPVQTLLPLVITTDFKADPTVLGISLSIVSAGSILGSVLMASSKPFAKNARGVIAGQFTVYASLFLLIWGVLTINLIILYISMFLNGFAIPIANVHSQTIWQSVVPPELQGRVMSVRMVIAWVMIPVANLVAGILADFVGPINIFITGFVFGLAYILYAWNLTGLPHVEDTLGLSN